MRNVTKKTRKNKQDALKEALYKKAVGYDSSETVEEYSDNDGDLVLVSLRFGKQRLCCIRLHKMGSSAHDDGAG